MSVNDCRFVSWPDRVIQHQCPDVKECVSVSVRLMSLHIDHVIWIVLEQDFPVLFFLLVC